MLSNSHSRHSLRRSCSPINQFAQQQLQEYQRSLYIQNSQKIKQKLKSINQLALSDQSFLPNPAQHKDILTPLQFQLSFSIQPPVKITISQRKNNPKDTVISKSIQASLQLLDQMQTESYPIMERKTVSEVTRFTTKQDLLEVDQDPQYCFDCDDLILIEPHHCISILNSLPRIQNRLLSIKKMAIHHKITRFDLLIYYISKNEDLQSLKSYLQTLKLLQKIDKEGDQDAQQIIRMRLVNILQKKIGIIEQE